MTITQAQYDKLNMIALTALQGTNQAAYEDMCEVLADIYKADIAEVEEYAKEITVDQF